MTARIATPYRCPTPCDEDCEINGWGCHECHDIPSHREHDPEACQALALSGSLHQLAGMGFDVVAGDSKGPGADDRYVSLEHLSLDEPEEFRAATIAEAMSAAREWAERERDEDGTAEPEVH